MFTNEGKTIIDSVKGFLFDLLFIIVMCGMGISFGILMTMIVEVTQVVVLGYILIAISSMAAGAMIKGDFEFMMNRIDEAMKEMKTKEETI